MIDGISLQLPRLSGTDATGATGLAPRQSPAAGTEGPTFAEVFEQVARDTVQSLEGAEATSISAMRGGASTREAVEAIMSAEHALQTATAIRDKIVQAYQEVSRMQI